MTSSAEFGSSTSCAMRGQHRGAMPSLQYSLQSIAPARRFHASWRYDSRRPSGFPYGGPSPCGPRWHRRRVEKARACHVFEPTRHARQRPRDGASRQPRDATVSTTNQRLRDERGGHSRRSVWELELRGAPGPSPRFDVEVRSLNGSPARKCVHAFPGGRGSRASSRSATHRSVRGRCVGQRTRANRGPRVR
jgi:hypothetical protein